MLLSLLWKDIRLNWNVILLVLAFVDAPFVAALTNDKAAAAGQPINVPQQLAKFFPVSVVFAAIASTFIGGRPIGSEMRERTDRFIATLPPTRLTVAISKLVFGAGLLLAAWTVPAIILLAYLQPAVAAGVLPDKSTYAVYYALSSSLVLFGMSWLASVRIKSTAYSAAAALFGSLIVAAVLLDFLGDQPAKDVAHNMNVMLAASGGVALVALVAGVALFVGLGTD